MNNKITYWSNFTVSIKDNSPIDFVNSNDYFAIKQNLIDFYNNDIIFDTIKTVCLEDRELLNRFLSTTKTISAQINPGGLCDLLKSKFQPLYMPDGTHFTDSFRNIQIEYEKTGDSDKFSQEIKRLVTSLSEAVDYSTEQNCTKANAKGIKYSLEPERESNKSK